MDGAHHLGEPIGRAVAMRCRGLAPALLATALTIAFAPPAVAGEAERQAATIRDVTAAGMTRLPDLGDGPLERIAPKAVLRPALRPKPVTWPRPEVLSAGRLRSSAVEIVIAGILPLSAKAECGTGTAVWPCGNHARAAFARLVRMRTVTCGPEKPAGNRLESRCSIRGFDLGEWLVRQGWAMPLPGSGYGPALTAAQQAHAGQWGSRPAAVD